ncbi:MAG TPA: sensor histidine kinase [Candidatus Dormibacteraeota bacterium]|nr:sensor histidine kinase [Candidatus Dormibacteraeota bacterium]
MNVARWTRLGRWFMAAWALLATPTAISVIASGATPANVAVEIGFCCWAAIWIWLWLRAIGRSHTAEVFGLVANTVVLAMFTLIEPQPAGTFLVFSFIVAGCIFPLRQAVWAMLALLALQIALDVVRLAPPAPALNSLINSVLVGGVGVGARLLWQSYTQLVAAREQLAHLAVTEERLRFARDLHDLLGQNLSVLVLKSELVGKQLPEDADESVRSEVRDIAQVARKSLNDVREAVAGYRRPTLQAEISSARSALRAAGIGLLVEDKVGTLPPEQDGVLAWCLREAVTNVVKHSGAHRCEVRIFRVDGVARLEVSDDGQGAETFTSGSGLEGMRERVSLVGGSMNVESNGGLHLHVSVPQPA